MACIAGAGLFLYDSIGDSSNALEYGQDSEMAFTPPKTFRYDFYGNTIRIYATEENKTHVKGLFKLEGAASRQGIFGVNPNLNRYNKLIINKKTLNLKTTGGKTIVANASLRSGFTRKRSLQDLERAYLNNDTDSYSQARGRQILSLFYVAAGQNESQRRNIVNMDTPHPLESRRANKTELDGRDAYGIYGTDVSSQQLYISRTSPFLLLKLDNGNRTAELEEVRIDLPDHLT
nr:MAG: hypothetical protein J07AB56_03920 [Candidatus Nanosalinarum sp. J07AB56]